MILAGDVGGTHTRLGLIDAGGEGMRLAVEQIYASHGYPNLQTIISEFLQRTCAKPEAAAVGVAGPVRDGRCVATNLPWIVDASELAAETGVAKVLLLNDLEANAYGIATLGASDFEELQPGRPDPCGNCGVVSPGTGLGEAGMIWDGGMLRPVPSEGGHASFAPEGELQGELFATLARRFCERLAANGTRYADLIVNPTHWRHWSRKIPQLIEALDAGFAAAEEDGLPGVGLCISLLRTQSADEAIELVQLLAALRHPRVVALSIDGNEAAAGRTGPRFAEAFRRAGAASLKRTVHAGESSGPEGVRDAVEFLAADRIDHGVRAIDDPAVVGLLAERQIPLGICPSSNITLGLYPALAAHPIDRLRRAGVPVSVNTDDPALLTVSLAGEYESCAKAFAWSADDVRSIASTSIQASFAPIAIKRDLLAELAAW